MTETADEAAVMRELAFEANTQYINAAYRRGFVISVLTMLKCFLAVRLRGGPRSGDSFEQLAAIPNVVLAVSFFKNERAAIEEHIAQGASNWRHVQLDPLHGIGVDATGPLVRASVHFPIFATRLVRDYGASALRRFAYPFIGFSLYRHLRRVFERQPDKGTLVTANMAHPFSLAIHYAARAAGWQTIYLEHAMTPRSIARDRGYSRLFVRSAHTRELLASCGIDRARIEVLGYWQAPASSRAEAVHPVRRVGFAVNDLDDLDCISYLAERLVASGIRCEIRVHDADRRLKRFQALGARLGVEISSAAGSGIADYVRRHDIIIVGNSSVLLDCARAGIPAIYFWSGAAEMFDYYGLAQYMNYPAARTPDDLLRMLAPR